jgi:hypothetical protein
MAAASFIFLVTLPSLGVVVILAPSNSPWASLAASTIPIALVG